MVDDMSMREYVECAYEDRGEMQACMCACMDGSRGKCMSVHAWIKEKIHERRADPMIRKCADSMEE